MPAYRRFRDVQKIGPVQVASFHDGRGRDRHTAACTAPGCDFSTEYDNRSAAELAARTHRCPA
ncbi:MULTISPECIES: mobile element transfer protein [unclassified Streptomyces]|uniref:mobile element transfer protein n=1 Tax=unclassified Streptomyces TaxID=2593676 RepID=UPI000DB9BA50|nr:MULTISPECIES: mobile element transfer protein [unclassified Streptomyces]MYT70307.1 Mobile element transfer [Streptomyces sp. SID8367]RAJ88883.1 mobile element transfer protein [Streptomyces sp. PsTaAH-137]